MRIQHNTHKILLPGALLVLLSLIAGTYVRWSSQIERQAYLEGGQHARHDLEFSVIQWRHRITWIAYLQRLAKHVTRAYLHNDPEFPTLLRSLRDATSAAQGGIVQVAAIDAKGIVIWSTTAFPAPPVDLSDREHFRAIAKRGLDHFVGVPVTGAVSHVRTFQFADSVRKPDRTLEGVTVVSVSTSMADALAKDWFNTGLGVLSLVRSDGRLLSRVPEVVPSNSSSGLSITPPFLGQLLVKGFAEAYMRSTIDHKERFYAGQKIDGYGLYAIVGIDAVNVLGTAAEAIAYLRNVCLYLAAALVGLTAASWVAWDRHIDLVQRRGRVYALEQSEALLHRIARRSTDMITFLDAALRITQVTDAVETILGYRPSEILGKPIDIYMQSLHASEILQELRVADDAGISLRYIHQWQGNNGRSPWLECEIVPIGSLPDGKLPDCSFLLIARDVTARVKAEAQLQKQAQEIIAFGQLGPGQLYRLDRSGTTWTFRIPGRDTVLGYPTTKLEDFGFAVSVVDPADRPRLQQAIETCLRDETAQAEYRVTSAEGDSRWIRDYMRRVGHAEQSNSILGYWIDVTQERDQAEQAKQLERLAAVGEIASGIAHEINQPLATISVAVANAIRSVDDGVANDDVLKTKLARISKQIDRISSVILIVKEFGRSDVDRMEALDLNEVVADVALLMTERLARSSVRLQSHLANPPPVVFGRRVALEQALINLVANSCDAYDALSVIEGLDADRVVLITTVRSSESVAVRVSDQAGGIPDTLVSKLFKPFFSTKKLVGGTGLGLAISWKNVMAMGASLVFEHLEGGPCSASYFQAAIVSDVIQNHEHAIVARQRSSMHYGHFIRARRPACTGMLRGVSQQADNVSNTSPAGGSPWICRRCHSA